MAKKIEFGTEITAAGRTWTVVGRAGENHVIATRTLDAPAAPLSLVSLKDAQLAGEENASAADERADDSDDDNAPEE